MTLGADLTEEDRETVIESFGVNIDNCQVIEINNQQEREYLEGKIPDEVIGTRTLSCSYLMPTLGGGIMVKTANLTWVSEGMLANALLTAGVENCQVIATAPYPVSGTGALTGVLTAYEKSSETSLDENKKQLATEELIVTGEVEDEVLANAQEQTTNADGTPSGVKAITEAELLSLLNDIKAEVLNGNLTEDKIKEILNKHLDEYKISLTEDTYNRLVAYLKSLSELDYAKGFKENLSKLTDRIAQGFDVNLNIDIDFDFKTDKANVVQFWTNIWNFFKLWYDSIISSVKDSEIKETTPGIDDIFANFTEHSLGASDNEESPVNEVPTENTPIEDTPTEDVPIEDTPTEDVPIEDTPVEDIPVEDAPIEESFKEDISEENIVDNSEELDDVSMDGGDME